MSPNVICVCYDRLLIVLSVEKINSDRRTINEEGICRGRRSDHLEDRTFSSLFVGMRVATYFFYFHFSTQLTKLCIARNQIKKYAHMPTGDPKKTNKARAADGGPTQATRNISTNIINQIFISAPYTIA